MALLSLAFVAARKCAAEQLCEARREVPAHTGLFATHHAAH
jgi:hypothetical protein